MSGIIREAQEGELLPLLRLYLYLHEDRVPPLEGKATETWNGILRDRNHHVIVAEENGKIVSSCVCVIIPNLTRGIWPYALIENVVTHPDHRERGLASQCLEKAKEIAEKENCYKIMLLTGSNDSATHRFYRRAGYNHTDKTAYIHWL